eukprot:TRINITY_DN2745_c1_g1_i5.p2 TRINITY_DN2745_c1_g1~~TRINITY_DN2745_c1_g1_i5.p2  ORF type:complete len:185 (+),score=-26.97 TRINITY_DN2745_c1_g1_i5:499-1053(+)
MDKKHVLKKELNQMQKSRGFLVNQRIQNVIQIINIQKCLLVANREYYVYHIQYCPRPQQKNYLLTNLSFFMHNNNQLLSQNNLIKHNINYSTIQLLTNLSISRVCIVMSLFTILFLLFFLKPNNYTNVSYIIYIQCTLCIYKKKNLLEIAFYYFFLFISCIFQKQMICLYPFQRRQLQIGGYGT